VLVENKGCLEEAAFVFCGVESLTSVICLEEGRTAGPSLPLLPPDFLWRLVALAKCMRLSLRKAAHAAASGAAWQEIRVRSTRDNKGGFGFEV
jgi:hypothetical protein